MTSEEFALLCDRWAADVKAEATKLWQDGVPFDRCLRLAIEIQEAKAVGTIRTRTALREGLALPGRH